MVYVKSNKTYACCFKVTKDGVQKTFIFDCLRRYTDTGNIATTGVTPIDEKDYDWLYANVKQFKALVDKGEFAKQKESGAVSVSGKIDEQAKEIATLKAQLAEKTKEAATATSTEIKEKDATIKDLKKQLEALKKKDKSAAKAEGNTEGF